MTFLTLVSRARRPREPSGREKYHVTVNFPVAVWPPTSVAVTVVPEVPLGTENVQLNAPALLVVNEPLVQLEMVTPSKTNPTTLDTEKPVPDTVTVASTAPFFGVTVIFGFVTLNVPVACWPPTSVAFTVVPVVPLGTLNVQLNAPLALDMSDPLVQAVITFESKTSPTPLDTENPVPETVTVAPMGPWPGVTVIAGVVTVNEPVAVLLLTSVAVTVVPDVPLGTRKVQLNVPVPLVVKEPLVHFLIMTPSKSSFTTLEAVKLVPATVTVAPTGPCPGVTVIEGAPTVNTVKVPAAV